MGETNKINKNKNAISNLHANINIISSYNNFFFVFALF